MKKPWSITTTVRNPLRIKDFLRVAAEISGKVWDEEAQSEYQKRLIQERLYGFGSSQFYNGLPADVKNIIDNVDVDISNEVVDKITKIKGYTDFGMRGRQSMNPLTKFGFIRIDDTRTIRLTESGRELLETDDNEIGKLLLKSFLKWQIPNPYNRDFREESGCSGVPFVLALKLISRVNEIERKRSNNEVGMQKREFALFATTLVNYSDIDSYAHKVIELRDLQKGKSAQDRKTIRNSFRMQFVKERFGLSDVAKINKILKNINDYGDNAIRYFRLTNFVRIRGGGFYIDIEPSRSIEIDALFESEWYKPKVFNSKSEYLDYLGAKETPILPWETADKLYEIAVALQKDVISLAGSKEGNSMRISADLPIDELKSIINELRLRRGKLRNKNDHSRAQPAEYIGQCIQQLSSIYDNEEKSRALTLEYLSTMGLHALNDAILVKPNYPVGDDNEPTSTAPGGMPDIECIYNTFNIVCEVTMLKNRSQWFNEGQPVMRHLRNFENLHDNSYCLFIAPSIHTDTAETFYVANKFGYKGRRQQIAPITIAQFISILQTLRQIREGNRRFRSLDMKALLDSIVDGSRKESDSEQWTARISQLVADWNRSLLIR